MNVTTKISVDLTRANIGARVSAVQGDGNTRRVEIALLSDGRPWMPPERVDVAIAYYQPGGTKGLYNLLADGAPAISITGNVATVILAPQMLTASGTVQASLVFNDAKMNRLTTFPFSVSVASNPAAGAQKVEDYLRLQWLEDKLEEYLEAIKTSGVFDGKPGDNGVTFTPSVAENGDLSWSNDGGRPNPPTVNIKGPKPVNGVDYGTPEQIAGIAQQAAEILRPEVSQIKDDLSNKLPKSPSDWEEWTAEEQAVARGRIGINEIELIADITLEEDAIIDVDFCGEFKKIIIVGNPIAFISGTHAVAFNGVMNDARYAIGLGQPPTNISDTSIYYAEIECKRNGLVTSLSAWIYNQYTTKASNIGIQPNYPHDSISSIKSFRTYLAGSNIKIYGVRG